MSICLPASNEHKRTIKCLFIDKYTYYTFPGITNTSPETCFTTTRLYFVHFVNSLLKLISFVRLEQLLQDLTGMFGERLVGTDLVAAESVVENIDSLARLVENVVSRQVEVKGTCFEQLTTS